LIVTAKSPLVRASRFIFVLAPLGLFAFAAHAQHSPPLPVHWTPKIKGAGHALRPGEKVTLNLTANIDPGWHVYAIDQPPDSPVVATQITVPDHQPLSLIGDIDAPAPESKMDPTIGKQADFYEGSAAFALPLRVDKKAHAGKYSLELDVRYQACNERLCLPPRTQKISTPVEIASR
jgi:DsbC/DsbD-like thiol-disulfide interchange protein